MRNDAISFLVAHDAKRRYVQSRQNIQSFDVFYEFLLTAFPKPVPSRILTPSFTTSASKGSLPFSDIHTGQIPQPAHNDISDNTSVTRSSPIFHFTSKRDQETVHRNSTTSILVHTI